MPACTVILAHSQRGVQPHTWTVMLGVGGVHRCRCIRASLAAHAAHTQLADAAFHQGVPSCGATLRCCHLRPVYCAACMPRAARQLLEKCSHSFTGCVLCAVSRGCGDGLQ